jgi:hypothetical protein
MVYAYAVVLTGLNLAFWVGILFGLPGTWLMVLVAALLTWWQPAYVQVSWTTLGVAAALAVLGEVLEFALGAAGARRADMPFPQAAPRRCKTPRKRRRGLRGVPPLASEQEHEPGIDPADGGAHVRWQRARRHGIGREDAPRPRAGAATWPPTARAVARRGHRPRRRARRARCTRRRRCGSASRDT